MDDASGDAARSYIFLHYVLFFIYLLFTGKYRYSLPQRECRLYLFVYFQKKRRFYMILQLEHIQKNYGTKTVLKDCTFSFERGKIYGLLGRNGAGKTTLFNCLTDEVRADAGEAFLIDEDGSTKPLIPSQVGYVFSTPILPDFLTGYEFIRFIWISIRGRELLKRPLTNISIW